MNRKLEAFAANCLRPDIPIGVYQWAQKNIYLPAGATEQPGPLSFASHPYAVEVVEAMRDRNVDRITLCWGSQTGKTTALMTMAAFTVARRPAPILWAFPTANLARNFSASRWMPFCRDSKGIAGLIPKAMDGEIDTERFTLFRQEFERSTVNFITAGSNSDIKSYPVSVLILDEIDAIPTITRRECFDRVKGRTDYKILQASTPTLEEHGVWVEYMGGDRRQWTVDCLHCGDPMVFRLWGEGGKINLKWAEDAVTAEGAVDYAAVKKTAHYACEKCGGEIGDNDKMDMVIGGRWVAGNTNPEPGHSSYHLNSFYSPSLTFGRMAVEYLRSQKEAGGLKVFVNGWLAEPHTAEIEATADIAVCNVIGEYARGEKKGSDRIISVDVQRDSFYWLVRGFDKDGRSFLVNNGRCTEWVELEAVAAEAECSYGICDTGYRTQEIYENIYQNRSFWFGAKGWERTTTSARIVTIDPFFGTARAGGAINMIHVNKTVWQTELLKCKSGRSGRWLVYADPDPDYIRQLNSTTLAERKRKDGKVIMEWQLAPHRQNHYWDCETYAMATAYVLGFGENNRVQLPAKRPLAKQAKKSFWR